MRPFVENRPAILQRFPQGIGHPRFIQHDVQNAPAYVTIEAMQSEEGRRVDYAVYTGLASLLYLTNLGTLEHHTWHSRIDNIEHPDWLVLDLYPGTASSANVLAGARVTHDVCRKRAL